MLSGRLGLRDATDGDIDQVAVGPRHRRRGLARALNDDLETIARRSGIGTLVCEVNRQPPNEASARFHEWRGFREVGTLATRGLLVTLLAKSI